MPKLLPKTRGEIPKTKIKGIYDYFFFVFLIFGVCAFVFS